MVLVIDYLLGRFITDPVDRLNRTAQNIADLNFTSLCPVTSNDEFGELSANIRIMSDNLQKALSELGTANRQLEKDVEQERLLLAERKKLTDSYPMR